MLGPNIPVHRPATGCDWSYSSAQASYVSVEPRMQRRVRPALCMAVPSPTLSGWFPIMLKASWLAGSTPSCGDRIFRRPAAHEHAVSVAAMIMDRPS